MGGGSGARSEPAEGETHLGGGIAILLTRHCARRRRLCGRPRLRTTTTSRFTCRRVRASMKEARGTAGLCPVWRCGGRAGGKGQEGRTKNPQKRNIESNPESNLRTITTTTSHGPGSFFVPPQNPDISFVVTFRSYRRYANSENDE